MRWLLFLSRLAFICGICFVLALSLLIAKKEWTNAQDLKAYLITIGFFIGILILPVTLFCYLVVILLRRNLTSIVPLWLIIGNILCMFALLFYIIFNNSNGQANYIP
jgi:hypothetical protein